MSLWKGVKEYKPKMAKRTLLNSRGEEGRKRAKKRKRQIKWSFFFRNQMVILKIWLEEVPLSLLRENDMSMGTVGQNCQWCSPIGMTATGKWCCQRSWYYQYHHQQKTTTSKPPQTPHPSILVPWVRPSNVITSMDLCTTLSSFKLEAGAHQTGPIKVQKPQKGYVWQRVILDWNIRPPLSKIKN